MNYLTCHLIEAHRYMLTVNVRIVRDFADGGSEIAIRVGECLKMPDEPTSIFVVRQSNRGKGKGALAQYSKVSAGANNVLPL